MQVILVRHGAYAGGEADPGLSAHGFDQARALGRFLARQGVRPGAVVTSDYRRALETAQTILGEMGAEGTPHVASRDFSPWGDSGAMRATVEGVGAETTLVVGHIGAETTLVVGHMCAIGGLARVMCPVAPGVFGTCMAVALGREGVGDAWQLLWIRNGDSE